MLLLAVDEEGDGHGMTDEQARDEAMVLFLAGHDTTAAGLSWAAYLLARHPEVQTRAATEVAAHLGGRPPTVEDVAHLPYLDAVLKETLRLYPPAWTMLAREATEDVPMGGYLIPRGGLVYASPWVTQRDPRWFAEPEKFDPERFLPGRVEQMRPHSYFPFGGGPRVCIGSAFALTEMVLVIACLLQRFRLAPAPGQGAAELAPLVSLRPRDGVRLTLTRASQWEG
jgi:cytochrome P450